MRSSSTAATFREPDAICRPTSIRLQGRFVHAEASWRKPREGFRRWVLLGFRRWELSWGRFEDRRADSDPPGESELDGAVVADLPQFPLWRPPAARVPHRRPEPSLSIFHVDEDVPRGAGNPRHFLDDKLYGLHPHALSLIIAVTDANETGAKLAEKLSRALAAWLEGRTDCARRGAHIRSSGLVTPRPPRFRTCV